MWAIAKLLQMHAGFDDKRTIFKVMKLNDTIANLRLL
jgi:hypothetical protein